MKKGAHNFREMTSSDRYYLFCTKCGLFLKTADINIGNYHITDCKYD